MNADPNRQARPQPSSVGIFLKRGEKRSLTLKIAGAETVAVHA